MIGRCAPVCCSLARICAVASSPSISGICTSISTRSNSSAAVAATASWPLPATVTVCPCPSKSATASFWLTRLSSASRHAQARDVVRLLPGGPQQIFPSDRDAQGQFDRFQQLGLFDRLQQVRGDPQLVAPRDVLGTVSRCQHHDHGAAYRRVPLDLFGKHEPVDTRHVGVGYDKAARLPCLARPPQQVQGFPAAGGGGRGHPPTPQGFFEDVPVRGVVVDHKHPHAMESTPVRARWAPEALPPPAQGGW